MNDYSNLHSLGTNTREFKGIETFPNPGVDEITFYTEEFTSLCPVTGQPDFASISIIYSPDDRCIESKSLKLYLQSFRNKAAFIEALAVEVKDTLVEACGPRHLFVAINSVPRGGLRLTASASFDEDIDDDDSGGGGIDRRLPSSLKELHPLPPMQIDLERWG